MVCVPNAKTSCLYFRRTLVPLGDHNTYVALRWCVLFYGGLLRCNAGITMKERVVELFGVFCAVTSVTMIVEYVSIACQIVWQRGASNCWWDIFHDKVYGFVRFSLWCNDFWCSGHAHAIRIQCCACFSRASDLGLGRFCFSHIAWFCSVECCVVLLVGWLTMLEFVFGGRIVVTECWAHDVIKYVGALCFSCCTCVRVSWTHNQMHIQTCVSAGVYWQVGEAWWVDCNKHWRCLCLIHWGNMCDIGYSDSERFFWEAPTI